VFKEEILPYLRKWPPEAGSHYIRSQQAYGFEKILGHYSLRPGCLLPATPSA
jgi:hypothetical protein